MAPVLGTVGEKGGQEDDEEGDEIGGRGEGLGDQCAVVHPGSVSMRVYPRRSSRRESSYSWTIVGRNGGRLEKAMLQLKNMH